MSWLELTIQTKETYVESLSDFLEQANAVSVTWKAADAQALFEPDLNTIPLWQHVEINALFTEDTAIADVMNALQREFDEKTILRSDFKKVPDQCWERVCLSDWQAMCFGQRLWVCPTTMDPPDPSAIIVRLDPGLAFGTGTHPSTALCLEWLDGALQNEQTLIDYGCGSGILAIAALKCGAKKVFAIDHDVQAIEATQANALQNAISSEQLSCLLPQQFNVLQAIKVDVLIANILAKPLMDLAPLFKQVIKKQGQYVLAGILSEQVSSVQQHYAQQGFICTDVQHQQGWARIIFSLPQ
jgi:ribosomal protein L11 methyltransferase